MFFTNRAEECPWLKETYQLYSTTLTSTFGAMPTKLPQAAEQIHDQDNEQDGANDSQAPASTPSGISVIPAASTKQQNQKDYQ